MVSFVVPFWLAATASPLVLSADSLPSRPREKDVTRYMALLKELRELQAAASREEASWELERQNLARLRQMVALEADEAESELENLRREAERQTSELAAARAEADSLAKRVAAVRKALSLCLRTLRDRMAASPVPSPKRLALAFGRLDDKLRTEDDQLAERVGEFWALALEWLSWAGEVEARRAEEAIDGRSREVFVLRLGSAAQFAVTPDAKAAWAFDPNARSWRPLDPKWARGLRRAVAVVRKRRAAQLVVLPIRPTMRDRAGSEKP